MWKLIYDKVFQLLTIPWTEFIQRNADCGSNLRDRFYMDIYQSSGLILFIVTIIICFLYYYYFNNKFGNYYRKKTYFSFMITNSLVIGFFSYIIVKSNLSKLNCATSSQYLSIILINFLYGLILFFVISIIIKWWSTFGKRTPF